MANIRNVADPVADPLWQDINRVIGQMFIMGWDGTEVTPQIRSLIQDHHLGSIILTAKNLKSAQQTAQLVQELQTIAKDAGHSQPLLIALDQENGGVNSLFDEDYVCQFPSQMGVAATGRVDLAYEVNKATASQLSACGINLMLGPVLDVLSNARDQPLGVRSVSDDPQEVSQYGIMAVSGIRDAGVACAGKHFPTYGSLDFAGSSLEMPVITQTLEQLGLSALVPFRDAIASGSLDGVFVGGVRMSNPSMNAQHACLSGQVVDDLLRNELGFQGVAISECLEMEALSHELGVQNGVVMAAEAGCDIVLLCRSYSVQLEAFKGMKLGIENAIITKERLFTSLGRVLRLKSKCTSWAKALNPPGISLLSQLYPTNLELSKHAYESSITVVRDQEKLLPLNMSLRQDEELLLLTPLIKPLPASALTRSLLEKKSQACVGTNHDRWAHGGRGTAILSGEEVFRELGRSLTRTRHGKVLHTSYTANGVRPVHENLINRASAVIIVTADANRNMYQAGFTKHVAMMCSMLRSRGQKKHLIVVAASSPYDFALDKSIGTYVCSFDYTENAMRALVRVLCGECTPLGTLPGTMRRSRKSAKSKQFWLVEEYDRGRDAESLGALVRNVSLATSPDHPYLATSSAASFEPANPNMAEAHFVVRNSSTGALYGFAATYRLGALGVLGAIFVDPGKRNLSIGKSLHRRAMRSLVRGRAVNKVRLGSVFPGVFLGIPAAVGGGEDSSPARDWFARNGWDLQSPRALANLAILDLGSWAAPEGLLQSIQRAGMSFDLVHGLENADAVLAHVAAHDADHLGGLVLELYREALARSCGVVRAKGPGGVLLGTIIVFGEGSSLATYVPPLARLHGGAAVGGVLAAVVSASALGALALQGLAVMGVRRVKSQKAAAAAVFSWASEDMLEPLRAMGFETLQAFEEITNSPDNWADLV